MTKLHDERLEELKILMPSVTDDILLFLATDNALKPWNGSDERLAVFHNPLMDFFRKFRIDRKKLQRILQYCSDVAANEVKNSFWRWEQESGQGEAHDMGSVAEVARLAIMNDGEQSLNSVTEAAQQVITDGGNRKPYLKLDPTRLSLIMRCDSALKRTGMYNGLNMKRAHKKLRSLVRKCELDSKQRPPDYWVDQDYRLQYDNPNVVYANGKFGDGTEYYYQTDENGKFVAQGRNENLNPMVPEFLGLTKHEQYLMVAKLYEQREKKQLGGD